MTKKNEDGPTIVGHEIQRLPVKLTPEELLEKGQQLAHVEEKMLELEAHAESVKKDLKAKETALIAERANLANIVRSRHEPRDVRVAIVHDYDKGVVSRHREDTGAQTETRPMHDNERQRILPGTTTATGKPLAIAPKLRRAEEPEVNDDEEDEDDDG